MCVFVHDHVFFAHLVLDSFFLEYVVWIGGSGVFLFICIYVHMYICKCILYLYSPIRFSIKALQTRWNQFHSSILDRFMHRIRGVVVHYHPTPTQLLLYYQINNYKCNTLSLTFTSSCMILYMYIHSFILSINCIFFIIPFQTLFLLLLLLYLQGYCCCELT